MPWKILLNVLYPILFALLINEYKHELWILFKHKIFQDTIDVTLVVGVLSARNNFEQRQAIRDTWLGYVKNNESLNNRVHIRFIVGSDDCPIPPEDRIDEYSCEDWNIGKVTSEEYQIIEDYTSNKNTKFARNYPIQQIQFKVLQPVILTKLGIHSKSVGKNALVRLKDAPSGREIVHTNFKENDRGELENGVYYKTVEAYMLPKGFEGIIEGENMESGSSELPVSTRTMNVTYNSEPGVIQFTPRPVTQSHYEDPRLWAFDHVPVVSFAYTVHENEKLAASLEAKKKRKKVFAEKLASERERLEKEQNEHGDIVLVDLVETYRNLPYKLMYFHKWAVENTNFDYLLKTDDDCYIDIEKILEKLQNFSPQINFWWGRFRHNWAVETYGKWSEHDYPSPAYPSFACGSGNVISYPLASWLVHNTGMLHSYQGEDVSMGIWLAPVGPQRYDDPMWQCEGECLSEMYAMPELSPQGLRRLWADRRKCGDPCGCS